MELEGLIGKFNDDQTPVEALLEYGQQIQNFFAGSPDPSKLDFYLGLAFPHSKTEGLLGYLDRKIAVKSFDKVKEAVFNLIQFVVVQKGWKSDAERFYIGFKNVADMYWKHSKETARLQQAALDCLISLFNNFGSSLDLADFDTSQLYVELLKRSEKSLYQPTVRGKMFHLMGILGSLGHDTFMSQNGWFIQLFKHVTTTVKTQVESGDSKLEVSILHGCIKGLDKLLNVFSTEMNVGDAAWLKFQEHLQKIVDPALSIVKGDGKNLIKRREFQRAALELVANHGDLIQVGLFKKYRLWFEDLILWAKSPNADDNRIGRRAMYKFLEMIILEYPNQFKLNADEKQRAELDAFFKYFADKFKGVLNTKNANRIELSIAIRGFGMLSNLCTEQQQSKEMLDLIMVHVDSIIHELDAPVVDKYSSSISSLPTYLESVASILPSLKTEDNTSGIPEHHLESIKKLVILLIRFYPDLNETQRQYAHIPVQKTFDTLWNDHHVLCEPLIEQVYQQSLLRIVSCPTKAEIDILIESWNKSHPDSKKSALSQLGLKPVYAYVHFWKHLLAHGQSGSHELQYDLLMQWILSTIGKLDLTIRFEDNDAPDTNLDPVQGATAAVVKDFQIFVNIVDFYQELMSGERILHEKFSKWVVPFSYEVLGYIKTNVFVSGFYKILAVVFDAARNLRYFEETANLENQNLQEKLNIFFQGLGTKIQEFRDDLLFSVLELWLSLPDTLILTNFTALNHTLKTVFVTGRSSFPLAIKGLEAVERWCFQRDFPVEEITAIMNTIFPILKTFFVTSENVTQEESTAVQNQSKKGNLKSLIKKNVQSKKYNNDPTLKATQLKILQLIGSFGQFIHLEAKDHLGLSKDQRFLQYAIPFQDCKPELFIDDLLPRVLELCENAVERQTRISACEFFHTISLIFIGKSREGDKEKLFRLMFHSILKLGVDSDIVVRQLFNPLALQMIHWFSKRNSPYGSALMDVLTENLTQHEDLNRREFAALCFGEYFLWTIKHHDSYGTDTRSKSILKTIFAMSTHASPNYRQGSVMAFNSIYKDFREDTNLISEFSFNLLFSFLTSLKLSKSLPEDCLLITSTKQSIKHLERIFTKKKDRFNTALRRHFKPTATKTETPCLRDVLNWLVSEAGSEAKVYRLECLRLIEFFAPLTKDISTVNRCLTIIEDKNGVEGWIGIAEGDVGRSVSGSGLLSFLDASSTVYEFLWKNSMLRKTMLSNNTRSTFWDKLMTICTSTNLQSFSEEEKLQLLSVFSRLKFAREALDDERQAQLWVYSIELSKNVTSVDSLEVMEPLLNIWCSSNLPPSAANLLLLDPPEDVSSVNDDQLIILLKESVWHRDIALGGLTSRILSGEQLKQLRDKLWDSVSSSLFKQSTVASGGGCPWEANNLSLNRRKLLENYLVTALRLGFDEDIVVEAAFDASSVSFKDGTFQLVDTKGNVLQKQLLSALVYCKQLFKFDILLQERPIKDVGDFIQRLLNLMKSDRILRKLCGDSVYRQTLANWKMISTNCDVPTSVKIFVGLLAINIDACKNSEDLSSWWSGPKLMQARHLDLKQKAEVFGFITVFATSRKNKTIDSIIKTISHVVNTAFKPEENWADVEQYITHIFRKILKVFEQLPKKTDILDPILWTIVKVAQWVENQPDHPLFRMARDSVEKVVTSICETDSDRVALASEIYQLITSGESGNAKFIDVSSVWKSFLLPAVSVLNLAATKNFFKKHIYDIVKKMEATPTNNHEWMVRTVSVHLLELLMYQTDADFVKGQELSDAYIRNAPPDDPTVLNAKTDNEKTRIVYRSVVKVCLNGIAKSQPVPTDDMNLRQCVLSCHEACYNTVVAALLVTKGEYKFFNLFLFCGKVLFERLVDSNLVYEFPVFVDEASHKFGIKSNRKRTKKSSNLLPDDASMSLLPASGNLSGSSLAPEATSYDFTTSVTVANSEFYKRIFANPGLDGENRPVQTNDQSDGDKLEWNEINKHGCMFAFVEVLKQMRIFHQEAKPNDKVEHSAWARTLAGILNDRRVHKNVKVFIVGGIINTPESVEPFAADLVEPIIKLILADCFGQVKLNHFVQDVIITLLSWIKTPGARPENDSVRSIFKYIVEGVKTEEISKRKDILHHVLDILQNVTRYWADGQENIGAIPAKEIYELGPINNATDESCSLRLNVCLSVLLGGQLPHPNVKELIQGLCKSATGSKYKGVYVTAAKCIGLVLRMVEQEAVEFLEEHITTVGTKLTNCSRTKPPVFVEALTAVQKYFPEIMTRLRNSVMELFQVPKLRPELLSLLPLLLKQQLAQARLGDISLNLSPSSPNCVDDFFTDIDSRSLMNSSVKTDSEMESSLSLFVQLIEHCAQPSRLLKMVDWLSSAESSQNIKIKTQFADCLAKLYDRLLTEGIQTGVQMEFSTKQKFLKIFIRMYDDETVEVREVVNRFWTHVLQDWGQSADLMLELLDLIGQEEHPLTVFLGLILQRCSLAPDHSKHIFQEPLENCQFVPFQLDTSWRLRHSTFQPLFAESLSSVQNFSTLPRAIQSSLFSQRRSVGKFGMNVLRATLANLQFTPTQQQFGGDTMDEFRMEVDQDNFNFDSSNSGPRLGGGVNRENNNSNDNQGDGNSPAAIGSTILKLRKKFYAQKDSAFYATRGAEIRTERVEEARDLERSRVSGVKTVRSYRIGELPDILIRNSDVLNTLLKLAKQDENFGRHFLTLLFQGMVTEMQGDQKRSRKFMSKSREIFDRVFRNTLATPDRALTTFLMELSIINSITLPITVVLDMCKICNLQALGILKLEQELLGEGDSTSSNSKRRRQPFQSQQGDNVWLGLAELYKEIEEYDVHRNIFANVEHSTTNDLRKKMYTNVGNALHFEGMGRLLKAAEMYDNVLDENSEEEISRTGKMFLEDSLMNCVAELGDWDTLYKLTSKFNSAITDDIFQDRENVERLIPMKMLSGMQLTLRNEDENAEDNLATFHNFVESSLSTEEGTSFLTYTYPFDIGVWLLLEDETEYAPQARLMLDRGYESIIRQLKNVDSLPLKIQRHLIMSLQQSSVLCDFRNWKKHGSNLAALEKPTKQLLSNWSKFLTHQPFDLRGNNLIASYRDCFLSKIGVTLEESGAGDTLLMSIQEQRVNQDVWLANLGAHHKSFSVCRNSLERLKLSGRDDIRPIEFRKSLATFLTVFAKMLEPEDWCKRWCSVWKKLDKVGEDPEVTSIKVDLLCCLGETIRSNAAEEFNFDSVLKTLGGNSSVTLNSCLLNTANSLMPESSDVSREGPSLYNKLFSLLKKITDIVGSVDDEIAEKMLCCILRSCTEQGDANQMLLLSHIFPLLKQFPNLNSTFELMVSSVPSFLFLPWIDQIITSLKSFPREYACFNSLISRLVKDFPQAFQLQYPEYLDKNCQLFGKALKAVVLPYKMHENMIGNILYEKDEEKRTSLLNEFQVTLQEIINNSNTFYGEYHTDYANDMFEVVNRVLAEIPKSSQSSDSASSQNGLSSQSWSTARKEMKDIADNHSKKVQRQRVIGLEKLSPFLANFHFFEHASFEKPGLYENFKKPNVQEHPLIVSFHPTVQYFLSMTRPIKFTVITNNGRRSNFLSKLGDDLRQDRRIQQLFKMSNVLFQKDVALKKRDLSLGTYACIPITSDFGLIEMIDNVMSLVELIFDKLELQQKRGEMIRKYDAWLRANCDPEHQSGQGYDHYRSAAKNVGREQAEQVYTQLVEGLPKYMLRDHIKKRSSNLQEFFSVRQRLEKCYGATSMVHWLLGIGDRHLDNCLLCMNSGNLVGIDFGRAFGTSNYVIPIPEMVPFRLTPQLQQIMMPYSYKGVFRESCILAWNCLVESSEIILTVANVFIQEPSVDWLKLRQGSKTVIQEKGQNEDAEMEVDIATNNQEYFPFEILKKKLLSHNPVHLLVEELKMHNRRDVPAVYCKIVEEGRLGREKSIVSSEEYVDILLDLATDKNILSRIFGGWNAWV